jgi:hypothetical protein
MKIRIRDIGLLAVGFVLGAILTALLSSTPPRPAAPPSSRVVAAGPLLASATVPTPFPTNFILQIPPMRMIIPRVPNRLDAQSPSFPSERRPVDLIDMRYQPDIKMDGLK